MCARPIVEVRNRFDVVWSTFAKRPHANNSNTGLRRLPERFRHALTILIAIHDCDIRTGKPKRLSIRFETCATMTHELMSRRGTWSVSGSGTKENRRARNYQQRGEQYSFLFHQDCIARENNLTRIGQFHKTHYRADSS